MTAIELVCLALVAACGWFVWDSLKARESANRAMRAACQAEGLLFLDDTVALAVVRPVRNEAGRLAFRRVYSFEFSDTGSNRRDGTIAMVGSAVEVLDLGVVTEWSPSNGEAWGQRRKPGPHEVIEEHDAGR